MRIQVKVKPRSKQSKVEKQADGSYKVWVREIPDKGKANEAVVEALSDFFIVPKSKITILSGQTSSTKIIEVL
jgi:uncharacterized protein